MRDPSLNPDFAHDMRQILDDMRALEHRLHAALTALRRYGQHEHGCRLLRDPDECTCGLDQAVRGE